MNNHDVASAVLMMCVCLCCFSSRSNVTPQSRLDLKLWSCLTLRKELLGFATIDLLDTLRNHDGKSKSTFKIGDIKIYTFPHFSVYLVT